MTEACGTCSAYNPDLGSNRFGKIEMPGFGICRHKPSHEYVSEWPWGCAFDPSRYEPADENAPPKEPEVMDTPGADESRAAYQPARPSPPAPDDRPPLELT